MVSTLYSIRANADLADVYAPSKEHLPTPKEPLTVRELLEQYPDDSFDMMTPRGFVYLTLETAKCMLAGESTMGNPGCGMEVTAEEMLPQIVQNASYKNGAWH